MTRFVFTVEQTGYHSQYKAAHIRIKWNIIGSILFIIPMRVSSSSATNTNKFYITAFCALYGENRFRINDTYSGDAINVPSNLC